MGQSESKNFIATFALFSGGLSRPWEVRGLSQKARFWQYEIVLSFFGFWGNPSEKYIRGSKSLTREPVCSQFHHVSLDSRLFRQLAPTRSSNGSCGKETRSRATTGHRTAIQCTPQNPSEKPSQNYNKKFKKIQLKGFSRGLWGGFSGVY